MKALKLFVLVLTCINMSSMAQVTVSLGTYTGAGSTNVLLSTSTTTNRYSRTISLYTASEIITAGGAAGSISSLGWDKNGTGEYLTGDAYIKIYLKHTSNSIWGTVPDWTTETATATEVFTSSTFSLPAGTGWKTFPFTTPFIWNGVDNIAVFVEWDRSSTPSGDISWGRSTTTAANSSRVGSTSLSALVLLINANRPLLQLTIATGPPPAVASVQVATQGSVPAIINSNGGSLQMVATILPASANQAVTWSLVPGTGAAAINATGLVTAQTNGSVWAKAVSVGDSTKMDSLEVLISNQIIPVTSVTVSTQGSVPAVINTNGGSLQMVATILPANANQAVTWSLVPATGAATISATGLVTAQANGSVWAKAVSVGDNTIKDSVQVVISNQIIPVTGVTVSTQGSVPPLINVKAGTLQLVAQVMPSGADPSVVWLLNPSPGPATISTSGLVGAITNGSVWAKAVSVQNNAMQDSIEITITNQDIGMTDLTGEKGFRIYPNPVSGKVLLVEMLDAAWEKDTKYSIIDATGKIMKEDIPVGKKIEVRLDGFPAGMYIFRLQNGEKQGGAIFLIE
jgi:hypothetical protein